MVKLLLIKEIFLISLRRLFHYFSYDHTGFRFYFNKIDAVREVGNVDEMI
jgi:hypothetical protein